MNGVTQGIRISAEAIRLTRGLAIEEQRQRQADRDLDEHGADGPGQVRRNARQSAASLKSCDDS